MQRFFLLLSLVFFLVGCTLPGTQKEVHTYEGDYARVVGEIIPAKGFAYVDTLSRLNALMMPSGIDNSWIRLVFDVPQAASGDVTLIANAQRETYKRFLAEMSLTGSITGPNGKFEFNSLRGKIFANAEKARYFGFLESFDITGSAVTREVNMDMNDVKEYLGKWWVFDQMDVLKNTSGFDRKNGEEMQVMMKAYFSFLQDMQTKEGFARLSGLFSQNPFFEATASGRLEGNEYVYPVVFSRNGTEKFVTKFYEQYAGTGLSQKQKESLISGISTLSGSGEFRVDTGKTPYFSFSGSLSGTSSTDRVDMLVVWHEGNMKFVFTPEGEDTTTSDLTYTKDDTLQYTLTQSKGNNITTIVSFDGIWKKDQKKIDMNFGIEKNKQHFAYNQTKDDFTIKFETPNSTDGKVTTPVDCQGSVGNTKKISCTILVSEREKVSFEGKMDNEGKLTGNAVTPSGNLDFDGHILKDDFLISVNAAGMTATLGNKKNPDGTYVGKLQLPVATVKWSGKIQNEVLSDFHIGLTSPVAQASLDLTKQDDHVQGPFSIKMQGQEISSGTIMMRSIPKYFDFRIDTILPEIGLPVFLELHKFTEIRWDPRLQLEEPTGAESIFSIKSKGAPINNRNVDFSEM